MTLEIDLSAASVEQLEKYSENIEQFMLTIDDISEITLSTRNAVLMELQSRDRIKAVGDPVVSINHPEFISVSE